MDEPMEAASRLAAFERLRLKQVERIRAEDRFPHEDSGVSRQRLVVELEAISWAEEQARRAQLESEGIVILKGTGEGDHGP